VSGRPPLAIASRHTALARPFDRRLSFLAEAVAQTARVGETSNAVPSCPEVARRPQSRTVGRKPRGSWPRVGRSCDSQRRPRSRAGRSRRSLGVTLEKRTTTSLRGRFVRQPPREAQALRPRRRLPRPGETSSAGDNVALSRFGETGGPRLPASAAGQLPRLQFAGQSGLAASASRALSRARAPPLVLAHRRFLVCGALIDRVSSPAGVVSRALPRAYRREQRVSIPCCRGVRLRWSAAQSSGILSPTASHARSGPPAR
jgi:hypothetical protein